MYNISGKEFEMQYKNILSGFRQWKQLKHVKSFSILPALCAEVI
jgi:hypothetical protein